MNKQADFEEFRRKKAALKGSRLTESEILAVEMEFTGELSKYGIRFEGYHTRMAKFKKQDEIKELERKRYLDS